MSEPGPEHSAAKQGFGPYTLLEELGRGGQGTVWLAEDHKLKRKVALKVLGTAPGALSPDRLQRFQREAEAAARLDDPHICALLDAGDVEGVPYLAFRYLQGEPLSERIARSFDQKDEDRTPTGDQATTDPSSREGLHWLVQTFEKLARALHVAHESGLIHRDVKPANIMILPDGEPVVLDFGLARDELSDDHSLTHSGDLLGTPAYMSPEQLVAQRIPLDRRTDVYSLGATLYEALTLHKPFVATTRAELYQKILSTEPSSAVTHNRQIPRDLQIVLETAMEKDRNRRYQTAEALAEDLHRVLAFEPVHAKPIGRLLRARRWAQRHPAAAVALAALFLALLAVSIALADRSRTLTHTRALALALASEQALPSDQMEALLLALEAIEHEECLETRSSLYAAVAQVRELREFAAHRYGVRRALFCPGEDVIVTVARDGMAKFWSLSDGSELRSLDNGAAVLDAAFDESGHHLITAGQDGTARIWRWREGKCAATLPHGANPVRFARFVSDSLAVTVGRRAAKLWSLGVAAEPVEQSEIRHDKRITRIAVSTSLGQIVTACVDGKARRWSSTGDLLSTYDHGTSKVMSVAFAPNERRIVTSANDGSFRLWPLPKEQPERVFHAPPAHDRARFSHDGRIVTFGPRSRVARVWHEDGTYVTIRGHDAGIMDALFTEDGLLVTASADQTLRVFSPAGTQRALLAGHEGLVVGLTLRESRQGPLILSASDDSSARLWELHAKGAPVLWSGGEPALASARFVPDGSETVIGTVQGTVELWHGHECAQRFQAHDRPVRDFAFPDGSRMFTVSADGTKLWSLTSGSKPTLVSSLPGTRGGVWCGLSRDGDKFLVAGAPGASVFRRAQKAGDEWTSHGTFLPTGTTVPTYDLVFAVWAGADLILAGLGDQLDWFSGKLERLSDRTPVLLGDHGLAGYDIAVSADGNLLVTAGEDSTLQLRDLDVSGAAGIPRVLRGHQGVIWSCAISPDGEHVLSGGGDGTVRLWSRRGEPIAILRGHRGIVRDVSFSPGGDRILSAASDGSARIWFSDFEDLKKYAKQRATRPFKANELERHRDLLGDAAVTRHIAEGR